MMKLIKPAVPSGIELDAEAEDLVRNVVDASSNMGDSMRHALDSLAGVGLSGVDAYVRFALGGKWRQVADHLWGDPEGIPAKGVLQALAQCARVVPRDGREDILAWLVNERFAHPISLALGGLVTPTTSDTPGDYRRAMERFFVETATLEGGCAMAQADLEAALGRTVHAERYFTMQRLGHGKAPRVVSVEPPRPEPFQIVKTPRELAFRLVDQKQIAPMWRVIPMAQLDHEQPKDERLSYLIAGPVRSVEEG